MLMTRELSELQRFILDVLRDNGDWMTRPQLAEAMNRPARLVPYDVQLLHDLCDKGLVERSTRIKGTVRKEHIYRAT